MGRNHQEIHMGQYRFTVPECDRLTEDSLVSSQIIGLEGTPWAGKTVLRDGVLFVTRNNSVSGRLLVPWKTEGFGELAMATGTLPESDRPYCLVLELARGSLSRLRNQLSLWFEGGLQIGTPIRNRIDDLVESFSQALFSRPTNSDTIRRCENVIDGCIALMFELTNEFSRQIAAFQSSQDDSVPVIAGSVLDVTSDRAIPEIIENMAIEKMAQPALVLDSSDGSEFDFSSTSKVIDWINSPAKHSVRIIGPILPLDNPDLPVWLSDQTSFEERVSTCKKACRLFGEQFSNELKILHVTSGISGVGHQHFNYPQQLQLTLEMLESLEQKMPNQAMMVSFDQPWGERLSMATGGTPAVEAADSLIRHGARLSALGLEFNLDYWPHGSLMRDPLQWVDLIDRWSQFGLPLVIYLCAPTGSIKGSPNNRFLQTIRGAAQSPKFNEYLETIIRLLTHRPAVNVIAWRRAFDNDNVRFPFSGLVDEAGNLKPIATNFEKFIHDAEPKS